MDRKTAFITILLAFFFGVPVFNLGWSGSCPPAGIPCNLYFLTCFSLIMYVVYRLLGFIPSGKRPQKNIKDLNKEFPNLNRKDSALQIVNYAEEFRDRFWRIKGMQAYPDEQEKIITGEKTNIFVMRRDNARESFKQLYECFELYKFQFNCRKELRDSINEMWSIFKPYSDKLDFWSDQKSPLEKQMKRVDEIVEKISQLLAPYVNAPLISSERFEKILKFEERKKNESKK